MDPLTEEIMANFNRELLLFRKKSPDCLFNKYFALKGVTDFKEVLTYDQSVVIGTYAGKFINGFCIVKYHNSTCYLGGISESLRQGLGCRSYLKSDLIYVGDYVKNLKCGTGKLWSSNKKRWVFDGHWDNDMKNGYGEMWRESATYKGNWVNDKMDGIGRMDWVDGQKYEGSYAQDMRNGEGTMTYVNGDKYTGTFKSGKPHGNGFYEWANGEIYEGSWFDGVMDGNGHIEYQIPVSGRGSIRMGSIHEFEFGLQTEKDWETNLMKSSQYIKSYRTSMIPESMRQLPRDDMGGQMFSKQSIGSIEFRNENMPMNNQMKIDMNEEMRKEKMNGQMKSHTMAEEERKMMGEGNPMKMTSPMA